MKQFITIVLMLFCGLSHAQNLTPSGAKNQIMYDRGGYMVDSLFIIPNRDTTEWGYWSTIPGRKITYWQGEYYFHTGNKWAHLEFNRLDSLYQSHDEGTITVTEGATKTITIYRKDGSSWMSTSIIDNDNQTLSYSNDSLSISGGNKIRISNTENLADTSEVLRLLIDAGIVTANNYTDEEVQDAIALVTAYVDSATGTVASGFQGSLAIADVPSNDGVYFPSEDGIYTSAGSIEVDLSEGLVTIVKSGSNFTEVVYPLNLAGYYNKTTLDPTLDIVYGSLDTAFTPSVNLLPDSIEYNKYWITSNGNDGAAAGWARTPKISVFPSTTYAISGYGNITKVVQYNSGGTFIGESSVTSTTDGRKFTTNANCASIGINISSNGGTGFDGVFQINEGSVVLPYEAPGGTTSYSIKPELLTDFYSKDQIDRANNLTVMKSGTDIFLRSFFSDTTDLIQRLSIDAPFNYYSVHLIPSATENEAIANTLSTANRVHSTGDNVCPASYNSTYIGGNHGALVAIEVSATAHGKTDADKGQQLKDGTDRPFYIIDIIDADRIWVLSNNTGSGDVWSFKTTISGNLTYVSGGVNTSDITVSGQTLTQLKPSIQGQETKIYLDGFEITDDGVYKGKEFVANDVYTVPHVPAVLDFVIDNASSDFTDTSIEKSSGFSISYRFDAYGSNTVRHSFRTFAKEVNLDYVGFIQSLYLDKSTASRKLYRLIPDVLPYTGATKTWDYAKVENITTGTIDNFIIGSAYWDEIPPFRWADILKTNADVPIITVGQGYSPINGITAIGERENYINSAMMVYQTGKMYPFGIDVKLNNPRLPANSFYNVVAFKCYTNPAANPNATAVSYYKDLDSWVVIVDYHQAVTLDKISLPPILNGYKVSTVRKSDNITINSIMVDANHIYVTVDNSITPVVAKAVLRLTK